ncbi:MAG: RluA family pseudouridine synthase [Actinomycetota bacterium]
MSDGNIIEELLPEALHGERLDRVVSMLDGCSRSKAAALIDDGSVEVDGSVVTQRSFRVEAGMRVRFRGVEQDEHMALAPDPTVPFDVLHADDHIVVVDKPPGVVVHPGAGRPNGTLANGLIARFPEIADVGDPSRPGIVHRLDGDTSGLLVVARSVEAYPRLVEAMSEHEVERVYAAAVSGLVQDDRGVVDAPIGRSPKQRTKMAVATEGRWARTHYEVQARSERDDATWLRCELETGRTHQIRVHLAAIGHPVIGDVVYGPRTGSTHIERVALHAHRLGLEHPVTGEQMHFEAPIPEDLAAVAEMIRSAEAGSR